MKRIAVLILTAVLMLGARAQSNPAPMAGAKAAPELVILDTDIGDDIDDAFALGLVLQSPELKLLGVTTAYGDTELRARLVDRYLDEAGVKIPVFAGPKTKASNIFSQAVYARRGLRFSTADPTKAWKHDDGVAFLLDTIRQHPGQITLIAIGPLVNVQAAIERDPETFRKLKRVVLMGGSIARGYDGEHGVRRPAEPEWNVLCDPAGLRALLGAGVPVFVMPLDSTQIHLDLAARERILAHGSPVTDQIALLYHQWTVGNGNPGATPTLFDPVAVAYVLRPELCPVKPMHLEVDAKGLTRVTEGAPNAQVCLASDEKGFLRFLEERLTADPLR
jgi:inosine-uridine nucleoside N-ribohydrolase